LLVRLAAGEGRERARVSKGRVTPGMGS